MISNRIDIQRMEGALPADFTFVSQVNALTTKACGAEVPLTETSEHLAQATLGHFIYQETRTDRRLLAYALNEISQVDIHGVKKTVNYFASAFILPEVRWSFSLYHFMTALRITSTEDFVMVRTQNPTVITSFSRFCKLYRCRLYSPLHKRVPRDVGQVIRQRFGAPDLVWPETYGRCITGLPVKAKTQIARKIMELIDPQKGDACVLVGKKSKRMSTVFPPPSQPDLPPNFGPTIPR